MKQLINVMIPNHMKFLLNFAQDIDIMNPKKRFKISEKSNPHLELNLNEILELSEEQKQLFFKQQRKIIMEKQFYDQYFFFSLEGRLLLYFFKIFRIICNLHNMKKLLFKANENLQLIFDDLRNILTPTQTAKFVLAFDKVFFNLIKIKSNPSEFQIGERFNFISREFVDTFLPNGRKKQINNY